MGGPSCCQRGLYYDSKVSHGPHGYNSHLSQPLTYLANRGHPDRFPLLVHRLKPQKAGEVRRARHLGDRERIEGDIKQRPCSLICLLAKVV